MQQGEHHSCGSGEKSKALPEIVIGVDETPKEQHDPIVANSGVCVCVEEGGVYICRCDTCCPTSYVTEQRPRGRRQKFKVLESNNGV